MCGVYDSWQSMMTPSSLVMGINFIGLPPTVITGRFEASLVSVENAASSDLLAFRDNFHPTLNL